MTQFLLTSLELSSSKRSISTLYTSSGSIIHFTALIYPLVIGEIDTTAAYYLSSGSVLIGIISIGCTISSPVINAKSEHVDYVEPFMPQF